MFKELQPLLATVASLTVSMVENADGTITLTVLPIGVKKGSKLDSQMQMVGTAAELDEGFAAHLASYTSKRQTLADQLAATEAILEAQQKEATDKAKKAIAKPAKIASVPSGISDDPDDDSLNGVDDLGASSTAPVSTTPTSAAVKPASDLWG